MKMNTHKTNNTNLTPILIGLSLSALVIVIIFWKLRISQNKITTKNSQKKESQKKESTKQYTSIKASNLAKKININKNFKIIDLRTNTDFKATHIVGSQNFSLTELSKTLSDFDKHMEYILIDTLGLTSTEIKALKMFQEKGFKKISYLEGGITQWENQLEPTVSFGNPYSIVDQSKVNYINSSELQKLLGEDIKSVYLIDVRTKNEFRQGHISGAENISLANLEKSRHQIPTGKRIILYDNNGLMAFQGAVRLFGMSILNVSVLSDGFNAWKQKKLSIEKSE